MKAVGMDIGTTSISGVVLELEETGEQKIKRILEVKTVKNTGFLASGQEWERMQDAEASAEKTKCLLDELLDRYPDVKQIGLTGQMHGIVYLDQEGSCVSPLYTWQDGRGDISIPGEKSLVEEIRKTCRISVSSGYGLVTHIYNLRHHLVSEQAVCFAAVTDYFGMYLTGRKRPLVHISNGASFGFFDVQRNCFEKELLKTMGVEETWLPDLCTNIKSLGTYRDCVVTAAIGDNQAAFLGAVGNREDTGLVNMGTGGQVSMLSRQYFAKDGIEARPFLGGGTYLLAGASLCGGRSYALLEEFFRKFLREASGQEKPLYDILERLAREGRQKTAGKPMERRLKVETTFQGTRQNPEKGGSITNLWYDNFTPECLAYGVLEGMGMELYEMYETIQRGTGLTVRHLAGAGNGLRRNPVLVEILEELFGTELVLASCEEEAAAGAALSSCLTEFHSSRD